MPSRLNDASSSFPFWFYILFNNTNWLLFLFFSSIGKWDHLFKFHKKTLLWLFLYQLNSDVTYTQYEVPILSEQFDESCHLTTPLGLPHNQDPAPSCHLRKLPSASYSHPLLQPQGHSSSRPSRWRSIFWSFIWMEPRDTSVPGVFCSTSDTRQSQPVCTALHLVLSRGPACRCHDVLTHSPVDGRSGCFWFLAVTYKAVRCCYSSLCVEVCSFLLSK